MIRSLNPNHSPRLVASLVLGLAGSLSAADLVVHNPYPEAMAGTFAVPAATLGIANGPVRLVRADTGEAVACQRSEVEGGALVIGGLSLAGYSGVTLRAEADPAGAAKALLVREKEKGLRIETALYALELDGTHGYMLSQVDDRVRKLAMPLTGWLGVMDDGEQDVWNGHIAKRRTTFPQRDATVAATTLYDGPCEAAVRLAWTLGGTPTAMIMRFNAFNRLVGHEVAVTSGAGIIQARYQMDIYNLSSKQGEATVLPLDERNPMRGVAAPGQAFIWHPERRFGVGLVAPPGGGMLNFTWEMRGPREGVGGDRNTLNLHSPALRGMVAPAAALSASFALVAGGTPQEAAVLAQAAGRSRAFTAYPGQSRPAVVLDPLKAVAAGRAQPVGLTCDERLVGVALRVQAGTQVLFNGPVPASRRIVAAWTPAAAGVQELAVTGKTGDKLADYVVEVRKAVEISALVPTRLVFKPAEAETGRVTLTNPGAAPSAVVVRSTVITGLDRRITAGEQSLTLAPGEVRTVDLRWASGIANAGAKLVVEVLVDGRVVDRAEEVFAVADSGIKVGQYGVTNPWCNNAPGTDDLMVKSLRNNYFSTVEYYCWTPCPFTGLTPPGDSWTPHTENMHFEIKVDKSFVQGMVRKAHEAGLQVFPWMNGEVALPTGLDRPEHYRYSASGQPLLYSGQIWNGKRFAIAYSASPYSEKEAYEWGKRLADSIDMFGWDGCRFDWEFTPTVVGDPMRAGETTWYTFAGKSSREVFTEPDKQGTAFLKAFRRGVEERYPGFKFGTNSGMSDEMWERQPEYCQESSRDSWMWYEHLMGYNGKPTPTWKLWAERLVSSYRRTRPRGAQVGVGWMRDYPPGTVTHKLLPFAVLFSGYKWNGPDDRWDSLGEGWKCWRYAMRFAQYFYGNDFLFVAPGRVGSDIAVLGDAGATWRPWVTERATPGVREVLIGVLNTPEDVYVSERRPVPAPRTGLKVKVALAAGERIANSRLLVSEPSPEALALPAPDADGAIALPAIPWAAAVLVRIEGGK